MLKIFEQLLINFILLFLLFPGKRLMKKKTPFEKEMERFDSDNITEITGLMWFHSEMNLHSEHRGKNKVFYVDLVKKMTSGGGIGFHTSSNEKMTMKKKNGKLIFLRSKKSTEKIKKTWKIMRFFTWLTHLLRMFISPRGEFLKPRSLKKREKHRRRRREWNMFW